MKQKIAIGIVAVALVGGTATGLVVREVRADDARPGSASPSASSTGSVPVASPSPTPTPSETGDPEAPEKTPDKAPDPSKPTLLPLGSMQINTGAVGPVRVGMTKKQAAATGYFNVDIPAEVCEGGKPLEWKSNYFNALDVLTDQEGTIVSIGISDRGPKTRSGLAVNSTYGEVRDVIGRKKPVDAGYGQAGLLVNDGDAWIGFLFDVSTQDIADGDQVALIEVTRGSKPGLMRDGC